MGCLWAAIDVDVREVDFACDDPMAAPTQCCGCT